MSNIQAAQQVAEVGSQEAANNFEKWSEERRIYYKNMLINYRNELNKCYSSQSELDYTSAITTAQSRRAEMNKFIETELKEKLKDIYRSGRGSADIAPKGIINQIKGIQDEQEKNDVTENLLNQRSSIYQINNYENFKKIAIESMQIINNLQEELTGIQEEIGVTFAEGGYIKLIRIPMNLFLSEMQNAISVSKVAALEVTVGDPWKLDINFNTSVISQLKRLNKQSGGTGRGEKITSIRKFENDFLLRKDEKYDVLRTGFVAEALARANILGQNYKYQQDNLAWYKGFDIYGVDRKTNNLVGVSMKSALFGSPTLLRINSLHTALNKLITALSAKKKNASEIAAFIKSEIYSGITDLDSTIDTFIDKELEIT